jgi:hypothetical protein
MNLRSKLIARASSCLVKASSEPERRQHWLDETINFLELAATADTTDVGQRESRHGGLPDEPRS